MDKCDKCDKCYSCNRRTNLSKYHTKFSVEPEVVLYCESCFNEKNRARKIIVIFFLVIVIYIGYIVFPTNLFRNKHESVKCIKECLGT